MRIGIDLGGTKIAGVALDGGVEVARLRVDTPKDDYDATVGAVAGLGRALEERAGGRGTVGVGIPGSMSTGTRLVKNANSVWLIGRPLSADLAARLDREVRVANDANCFAISEATDGAGAGADVVFGVIVGTGTGAGMVVRGELVVGPNALTGEWGHNPLPWAGDEDLPARQCYCGRRGCIETFLSGPGMEADYERQAGRRRPAVEIAALAAAGDAEAAAVLVRYESRMARALASIINVLDPDVIVLGGGMSNIERLYATVPVLWTAFVFACGTPRSSPNPHRRSGHEAAGVHPSERREPLMTRLVRARHGDISGVRGAAWLWPDD